jgi:hypothetical protein
MTPGSVLVQLGFFIIAVVLILIVRFGIRRASLACGDGPDAARRLTRRFEAWAVAWFAIVIAVAASGALRHWEWRPPLFPVLALAMTVLGVRFTRSTFGDRLARGVPLAWLVGFQGFRLPLELLMHRAYTEGVMPVQMSYSGRNLDVVTGATAIVLAIAMSIWSVPKAIVWIWNVMGLMLLFNIVGVAVASLPLFQAFGPDRVNTFVTYPPYVLLPAIMVLAAWAGHLVVFKGLLSTSWKLRVERSESQ